ncbi:MAG: FAD-dependent oxidoreductase [Acetivibrionales bacterium]|jgi:phytoene desaturase
MKDAGLVLQKYKKVSLKEYAKTFKHPALREALASFLPDGYSALSVFFALAAFTKGQASLPYGGSRKFSQRMVERYSALGGVIEAPCEAIGLELDSNEVRGAICGNGKVIKGDYFIVACDARVLYDRLLKGGYNDPLYQKRFDDPKNYPLASEIRIALGFQGTINNIPRSIRFPITPFKVNETWIDLLNMTHYGHEPNFAPAGHTLITCSINQFTRIMRRGTLFIKITRLIGRKKQELVKRSSEQLKHGFLRWRENSICLMWLHQKRLNGTATLTGVRSCPFCLPLAER